MLRVSRPWLQKVLRARVGVDYLERLASGLEVPPAALVGTLPEVAQHVPPASAPLREILARQIKRARSRCPIEVDDAALSAGLGKTTRPRARPTWPAVTEATEFLLILSKTTSAELGAVGERLGRRSRRP